jgi:hypothetical protein
MDMGLVGKRGLKRKMVRLGQVLLLLLRKLQTYSRNVRLKLRNR